MEIASIRHKALRRFAETGFAKGLIEAARLVDMLTFIAISPDFEGLAAPPNYGFHALSGDRKGTYAMTVTRNWRLTFVLLDDHTIAELDLEDYH
jgi:toxin HigB-1